MCIVSNLLVKHYQAKVLGMLWSDSRRCAGQRFLKQYSVTETVKLQTAQRQAGLKRLQIAGIVKKAVTDNDELQQKLFESVKKQFPNNPNALEIFKSHLEEITSQDPDGYDLDTFGQQFLNYLDMGDYAGENDDDGNEDVVEGA